MGDPGQRTFYLQARQGGEYLAVIVEKEHVAALAQAARALLAGLGETLTAEDLLGGDLNLEPVQPEWRAGALRMGGDRSGRRFLLEIEPLGADGEPLRLTMGPGELRMLAVDAAYAVQGMPTRCPRCGRRLDPDGVHACRARR